MDEERPVELQEPEINYSYNDEVEKAELNN